jgi:hypothetical protein
MATIVDGRADNVQLETSSHTRTKRQLQPAYLRRSLLNHTAERPGRPDFLLKCPELDVEKTSLKSGLVIAWTFNGSVWFSVNRGMPHRSRHSLISKIQRWKTSNGFTNIIATDETEKYKFEYEESRPWFALRIQHLDLPHDEGLWSCKVALHTASNGTLRLRSQKWIRRTNKTPKRAEFIRKRSNDVPSASEMVSSDEDTRKSGIFTFSKPHDDFATFSRISKVRDVAYIRNGDILELMTPDREHRAANETAEEVNGIRPRNYLSSAIIIGLVFAFMG